MRNWTADDWRFYEEHLRRALAATDAAADAIEAIVRHPRLWEGTATPDHNEDELRALEECLPELEGYDGGWFPSADGHDYVRDILAQLASRGSPCAGCGEATEPVRGRIEMFILRDHIWEAITKPGERFLCVGCVESRLGRELTPADFPRIEMQREGLIPGFEQSDRLRARLWGR